LLLLVVVGMMVVAEVEEVLTGVEVMVVVMMVLI